MAPLKALTHNKSENMGNPDFVYKQTNLLKPGCLYLVVIFKHCEKLLTNEKPATTSLIRRKIHILMS